MLTLAASHANSNRLLVIGIVFVVAGAGNLAARWFRAHYPSVAGAARRPNIPGLSPQVDMMLSAIATIVGVVLIIAHV